MLYFFDDRKEQLNTLIAQYQQMLFIEEQKLLNTQDSREMNQISQAIKTYKERLNTYLSELKELELSQKRASQPQHLPQEDTKTWQIEEHFRANQRKWWEGSRDTYSASIKGGVYVIDTKVDKTLFFTILTEADFEKDYEIEAQISYIKGEGNNGFGLCWGDRDLNDVCTFEISNSGSAVLRKLENNQKWRNIAPWTSFYGIYDEGIPNVLNFSRQGEKWIARINQHIIFESAAESLKGKDIGLVTQTVMKIVVNYIKFKQL